MTRSIWKFAATLDDLVTSTVKTFTMPSEARPISVGSQLTPDGNAVVIWAVVEPWKMPHLTEERTFRFIGTGEAWPENTGPDLGVFLGTAQFDDLRLVLHVFDLGPDFHDRITQGPRTIGGTRGD